MEAWCGTSLAARCPFHDSGHRFSCHLSLTNPLARCPILPLPAAPGFCKTLAGRTLLLLGDSVSRQMHNTARCHACADTSCAAAPPTPRAFTSEWEAFPKTLPVCTDFGACGRVCYLTAGSRGSRGFASVAAALGRFFNGSASSDDSLAERRRPTRAARFFSR